MEKIILTFYIDVRNLEPYEVSNYMQIVSDNLNSKKDENVLTIFIPIYGESRVECLNPKLVSEFDYNNAKNVLENNEKLVKDTIEKLTK